MTCGAKSVLVLVVCSVCLWKRRVNNETKVFEDGRVVHGRVYPLLFSCELFPSTRTILQS